MTEDLISLAEAVIDNDYWREWESHTQQEMEAIAERVLMRLREKGYAVVKVVG